jgi:hypothetical protein
MWNTLAVVLALLTAGAGAHVGLSRDLGIDISDPGATSEILLPVPGGVMGVVVAPRDRRGSHASLSLRNMGVSLFGRIRYSEAECGKGVVLEGAVALPFIPWGDRPVQLGTPVGVRPETTAVPSSGTATAPQGPVGVREALDSLMGRRHLDLSGRLHIGLLPWPRVRLNVGLLLL